MTSFNRVAISHALHGTYGTWVGVHWWRGWHEAHFSCKTCCINWVQQHSITKEIEPHFCTYRCFNSVIVNVYQKSNNVLRLIDCDCFALGLSLGLLICLLVQQHCDSISLQTPMWLFCPVATPGISARLSFHTGTIARRCYININSFAKRHIHAVCLALPGLHAFQAAIPLLPLLVLAR